jgi:RNA polymerase sigma-70 factor, ECF subfamily
LARERVSAYNQDVFSLTSTFVQVESPDTRSLLEKARTGDGEAFGELCRDCEGRLLRQAMTLCGNEAMAEDLAQETLVEAWKSLRRYDGRCQFFTWVCAILLNRFRNVLRQKRPVSLEEPAWQEGDAPDQQLLHGEQAALVRKCIAALPPKHRQVIFLRFYVDDSLPEIAAALGCSVGTVKSRLFNALEKLRRMNLNV